MNAVEIEAAISELAAQPFEAAEFPFAFLAAFGNKDATLKRLRAGNTNTSDVPGGVLQRNNIHIAVCKPGTVGEALKALRFSPSTIKAKAKFILATDGHILEAEELANGEILSCAYPDFSDYFGFFLPLAGISTIEEIKDNPIDVRATGRLNKLYVELLRENPEWSKDERRADMNHLMARLIFCFFAEDTDIFDGNGLFTQTVDQMSERDASNTHEVLQGIFRAMNLKPDERAKAQPRLPNWANGFPYVNGGLFAGVADVPRFTRIARTYLLHAGSLNWKQINPDIFGSMIQAVADDEERGALGMHYTSVPNILKVLNPLFLDNLRGQLDAGADNKAKLLNLRKRMARIRVFDPACGSGNFLVIAYKQMREIEAEINRRRGEPYLGSEIPIKNFRGIELRNFPAEIARLALIIAEFQCDVLYRGQKDALAEFLPLDAKSWITCGNALRMDWISLMDANRTGVKLVSDDLFGELPEQKEIEFQNEHGEIVVCGNPPYQGSVNQTASQKEDMARIFEKDFDKYKDLDYVAAFMFQAAKFNKVAGSSSAFVTTNSISQGEQVAMLWPLIYAHQNHIQFARRSFLWSNLASNKAAVTCVIIGLSTEIKTRRSLFDGDTAREVDCIGPYLLPMPEIFVRKRNDPIHKLSHMDYGNKPTDGGNLILSSDERETLLSSHPEVAPLVRAYIGSHEFIHSDYRYCLWIEDHQLEMASAIPEVRRRIAGVHKLRSESRGQQANNAAEFSHRFVFRPHRDATCILIPQHFSERRKYLTAGLFDGRMLIIANSASAIYDATLVDFSILASRLHMCWVDAVGGRIKSDYRYSSTLVWNTFPVPLLTEQNQADLLGCAEDILLAREAHFPATPADLYDPDNMPENLRHAHERNDEILERIYIGRRFKNDTERLEKLFELYTKSTAAADRTNPATKAKRGKRA